MDLPDYPTSELWELLSIPRMNPYLGQARGDQAVALRLYEWSTRMAAAAFETVAHLEVVMRNAIDRRLRDRFDEVGCGIPWFLLNAPMNPETSEAVSAVRNRLREQHRDTRHQIIAGLSFGFWSGMLGRRYEDLWRESLRLAFPHSSGDRKQVAAAVEGVRKFRNKIAHHDSMLNVDIPFELRRVIQVAAYISPDAAEWLSSIDRSGSVYAERPARVIDTVVVAARNAYAFYEQNRAYVCQPGRWFRPVERIAFYKDQEIKPDIAKIIDRRDNVPWTDKEAGRLKSSNDRADRRVGSVIEAARQAGWTDGVQQVFILTRPGDATHRQLSNALPHHAGRRGAAFTQRQRYVSLHALETAQTTADLVEVGSVGS